MSAVRTLRALVNAGLSLTVADDRLRIRPASGLTDRLRREATAYKSELIDLLAGLDEAGVPLAAYLDTLEQREAMADQIEIMDGARSGAREFFDSLKEGEGILKSLEDAFGRFADALFDWASNGVIESLFGKQGQPAGGSAGGWISALFGSTGSSQGSLADLFSGAWGFAGGGTMAPYSAARVNELGMEMATVGGNDYLLTGAKPAEITPHHKLNRGGVNQTLNFNLAAPTERSTAQQIANRAAFELQLAQRRR